MTRSYRKKKRFFFCDRTTAQPIGRPASMRCCSASTCTVPMAVFQYLSSRCQHCFLKKRRQNCCSDNSNADDGSSVEQRARQLRGPAAGSRLDVERADEEVDVEEVVWEGAAVSTDIGHNCSVQLEPP